ncbi:MAG: hypothetical protein ABI592_12185 [Acidobacteriota bacterium]
MTHEEFVSAAASLTDADAPAVLAHVSACRGCRSEGRRVDRALARAGAPESAGAGLPVRVAAAAAVCAVLLLAANGKFGPPPGAGPRSRYRIVGDAAGVVAYTPGGIVAAVSAETPEKKKEVLR